MPDDAGQQPGRELLDGLAADYRTLAIAGDEAVIRVHDSGAGFDPHQVEDPLAPENLLKPNGRGIFYMKSFMDEIEYEARPEGGTVVTLRKRITRKT